MSYYRSHFNAKLPHHFGVLSWGMSIGHMRPSGRIFYSDNTIYDGSRTMERTFQAVFAMYNAIFVAHIRRSTKSGGQSLNCQM